MVGERNGNAIVVDGLFIDTDFQIGESEDIGTMGGSWDSTPGSETRTVSETLPEGAIFLIILYLSMFLNQAITDEISFLYIKSCSFSIKKIELTW